MLNNVNKQIFEWFWQLNLMFLLMTSFFLIYKFFVFFSDTIVQLFPLSPLFFI